MGGCATADERRPDRAVVYGGPGGALLRIDQDDRFELREAKGPVRTGRVHYDGDEVVLESAGRLTAVAWGPRLYLVRTDALLDFCNAVNLGDAPEAFLRHGDDRRPAEGAPRVPAAWRGFLRETPVVAEVIEALPSGRARIGAGRRQGLFEGMLLYVGGRTAEETWLSGDYLVRVAELDDATAVVDGFRGAAGLRVCSSRTLAPRLLHSPR